MNIAAVLKSLDNTTTLIKKSEVTKRSLTALGADFEEMTSDQLAKLRINNGVKIKKLVAGKLLQVGIKEGFVITSIDKKKVSNTADITNLLENKTGTVLIEGFYPNGARAYYGFAL
jgi:S1-C subfamily serine protease